MTYLLPRLASCEVCGGGLAFRLFLETELPLIHPETMVFFFSSIILGSILTWEGGRMKEKKERKDKNGKQKRKRREDKRYQLLGATRAKYCRPNGGSRF